MCVARVFVTRPNPWFLFQILFIIHQSLYAPFQMKLFLLQIYCLGAYPWAPSLPSVCLYVRPGWGLCCTHKARCPNIVVGDGFEWVSLRRCSRNNLGTIFLFRQSQSRIWLPVRLLVPPGTWYPSSLEHLGVQPRNRDCDTDVNPTFNVWNGFIHFCGHESTQSSKYNLDLLAHNPIKREDKRRKVFLLVVAVLPMLVLLQFSYQGKILSVSSVFQFSASASPKLTSMIASIYLSQSPWIDTFPRVSGMLPPWNTPPYDIMWPWWIRGLPHTQLGEKSFLARWMIFSSISLWRDMMRPPFL